MTVDKTIGHGAPGIAEFSHETWGGPVELRLSDTPPTAVKPVTITASGAALELPLFSVVDANGLAAYQAAVGSKTVIGITTAPISIADGESVTIDVLVAGHYDFNALTFDSTFDTDEKKMAAFDGLGSPINMILGTNPHSHNDIY